MKNTIKRISALIATVMIFSVISVIPVGAVSFTPNFEVVSEAVYLKNLDTGDVIYEKNSDKKEYPASLTKIMTAILVLENIDDLENTEIEAAPVIFDEFVGQNVSTADFRHYEIATASDLMYGMMLNSACEAASILAYYVGGGSVANFVDMMNEKAKELGAENTHFVNPHGLFDEDQYTTAHDIAIITEYAMSLPKFTEIATTQNYTLATTNKHSETRVVIHTNYMMDKMRGGEYYYPYVKGIKTGTLDEAGRCLVSLGSKDGHNYLLVTMQSPMYNEDGTKANFHYTDAKNLYNWAFDSFAPTQILSKDEELGEVSVEFSDGSNYVLVKPAEEYSTLWQTDVDLSNIERKITLAESVVAPVTKGTKLGEIELNFSGENLATIDLIATEDVARSALKYNLAIAKEFTSSGWFKLAVALVIVLIVMYIIYYFAVTRKKRRRMKHVNRRRKF